MQPLDHVEMSHPNSTIKKQDRKFENNLRIIFFCKLLKKIKFKKVSSTFQTIAFVDIQ